VVYREEIAGVQAPGSGSSRLPKTKPDLDLRLEP
jgi:hypothetical protein